MPGAHVLTDLLLFFRPQYHAGLDTLQWKVPSFEWRMALYRVEQGEPLRKGAKNYNVSYESIPHAVRVPRCG